MRNSRYKTNRRTSPRTINMNTITILMVVVVFATVIIVGRLFYLQVIKYGFYQEAAAREHSGYTELPAKRGEILVKDYTTDETYTVASNTTMDLVFVDPKLIKNKTLVATALAESLFDLATEREKDNERIITERREFKRTGNMEAYDRVTALTDEELKEAFYHDILDKVSRETRSEILLDDTLPQEILDEISEKNLNGIEISKGDLMAYPSKIYDKRHVAKVLSDYVQIAPARLEQILIGENRYEIIAKKVSPEKSRALREIIRKENEENPGEQNYIGIGFKEEYYRYYPESVFASNLLVTGRAWGDGRSARAMRRRRRLRRRLRTPRRRRRLLRRRLRTPRPRPARP